jgi:hypothetical protein
MHGKQRRAARSSIAADLSEDSGCQDLPRAVCARNNRPVRALRVGDLVFYDPRSADERSNIMSTASYNKIGCEVVAVDDVTATLKRLGSNEMFREVSLDQIELQRP